MPHEVLTMRVPPELKQWLEAEVRQRKARGDRQANMTALVIEILEEKAKATLSHPMQD